MSINSRKALASWSLPTWASWNETASGVYGVLAKMFFASTMALTTVSRGSPVGSPSVMMTMRSGFLSACFLTFL